MTHYLVAKITISDRQTYAQYEAGFMDILNRYEGKLLAVDEQTEIVEGDWRNDRTVILSFDSAARAKTWYDSSDYQKIVKHRHDSSVADIVLIKGLG